MGAAITTSVVLVTSRTYLRALAVASGQAATSLALIAITFGWIGHHTNRQKMPRAMADHRLEPESPFAGAYFLQFAVEVGIIVSREARGRGVGLEMLAGAEPLEDDHLGRHDGPSPGGKRAARRHFARLR